MYAHEVTRERQENGIPYHKEVLFWFQSFAQSILAEEKTAGPGTDMRDVEFLINLINLVFPPFEVTSEEKRLWTSGLFSGQLGENFEIFEFTYTAMDIRLRMVTK